MTSIVASISVLCYNRLDMTKKCVEHLARNTPVEDVEFIFTDNCSKDGTYKYLESLKNVFPNIQVISHYQNIGYPAGHNEALIRARGSFFIVLNNDIFIHSDNWLMKLLDPLIQEEKVAITGLKGSPSIIKPDGNGTWGDKEEYVEGSCLAAKTELLHKYGLFSPALKMFYFEDSDLSFRYRQMGYEIKLVDGINYEHVRGPSFDNVNPAYINSIRKYNQAIWWKRWAQYVQSRVFVNRILIKMEAEGIGDIVAATPILEGLRRDHPTAKFSLITNRPEIFENNKIIDEIIERIPQNTTYDRVIDVFPKSGHKINYASYNRIADQAAEVVGTKHNGITPHLSLKRDEVNVARRTIERVKTESKHNLVVAISTTTKHQKKWNGRGWPQKNAEDLIHMLHGEGIATIELGSGNESTGAATLDLVNQTTLREYMALIMSLTYYNFPFVCIDSLALHIAQAFGVGAYCLFGATEPIARVTDFSHIYVIRNESLPCLGCYQKKGVDGYNNCAGGELCMKDLSPELIMSYLMGSVDLMESNMNYLQNFAESRL